MNNQEKIQIIKLIKQEVVPAIGCTEPAAVSLAVSKATEILGLIPDKIEAHLSANVLKNAMGVGIPGTNMIGLPIAVALGAIIGKSEYQLEVLKDITPESLIEGKKMIEEKKISIHLKDTIDKTLYIEIVCFSGEDYVKVIIQDTHINICYIEKNNSVLLDDRDSKEKDEAGCLAVDLSLQKVYDFAMQTPLSEIRFILDSARLNKGAAVSAFHNIYGHALGQTILNEKNGNIIIGNSIFSRLLSYTSAACDARMAGAMVPVMTNSGSGNQGIAATLPVVIYAEDTMQSEEELIRALILSHLVVIYIKQYLGRLSALCGCVVAATGSACGITYLMGGDYEKITFAVKNMVANLTGMICDGAKPSCALKVSSGVATAMFSAMMAIEGKAVTSVEGIIDEDVDQCIKNLALIGSKGMKETDRLVLDIMIGKK